MAAATRRTSRLPGLSISSRPVLLFAFALAVIADPVSSVAYAIEAALRIVGNDLALLLPTMALVVAIIGLIILNYHLPRDVPQWYAGLQALIGAIQILIAAAMLRGYRRSGPWGAF